MFVLCISLCPTTVNATVVWSDDFNDGTYAPEWTICDNLTFHDGGFGWNGSTWRATNNYLEKVNETQPEWGVISHPSNIAYGTWSFDVKANGTIFFICNSFYDMDDLYENSSAYFMWFDANPYDETFAIYLAKRFDNARTILDSHYDVPLGGWNHIDVTRNTTGYFSVYLDRSPDPIMEVQDTDIDTSEMFWLWFHNGDMIDNIVVDDDWHYTTTTTLTDGTTDGGIPPIVIIAGVGIAVVAIVLVVVFTKRR